MSLSDRDWTSFMVDAEWQSFGASRLVKAHNEARAEAARLREAVEAAFREGYGYVGCDVGGGFTEDAAWDASDAKSALEGER